MRFTTLIFSNVECNILLIHTLLLFSRQQYSVDGILSRHKIASVYCVLQKKGYGSVPQIAAQAYS